MTKYSQEVIEKRMTKLREAVHVLKILQKEPEEEFRKDLTKWYATLHAFLIATESILDIGGHILSSVFQQSYDEYKEIVPLLVKHQVIPQEFAEKLKGMAEFRNKLVHEYPDIAIDKVYKYLQENPELFIEFAQHIEKFIEKREKSKNE